MQQVQVTKWGNSLGFRIPRGVAAHMAIQAGDTLELTSIQDGLLLKKAHPTPKVYALASILDSFVSGEQHAEVDFGKPQGEEIW